MSDMNNLNLELIEKVKSGVACIEHTQKEKDLEKLTVVLKYLFPNDTAQILGMGKYYYTFNNSLSAWWQSQEKPHGMESIPLSAFFTNELPKEDKQLISKIDELLGQLKTISQSVFELREHASLVLPDVAPIEQVEQPKSIVKEEVKERWKPKSFDIYFYIKEDFTIHSTKYSHPSLDDPRINAGNCFKTFEQAQELVTKIKELLKD